MDSYEVAIMVLKFKDRKTQPNLKKVLIYGLDGSGKSTFAEEFCQQNGLTAVVIDVDDTNYTNLPIVEINLQNDLTTYNSIKKVIEEIGKTDDFDTIILDGVTSLLELLTSKAKGMAAYSDRSKRWNDILRALLASKKNIIFIGQIDMELIYTPDAQSSKAVIKVNSMVNEKYLTYIDKDGNYCHEVKKFRTIQQVEAEAKHTEPKANLFDDAEEIARSIVAELPRKDITAAKMELAKLNRNGIVSDEECPRILKALEGLV